MEIFVAIIFLTLCWICTCPVAVNIIDIDDYNPGSCDQSNALQLYLVNDRSDQKKLWICSNENGKYMWKPVDGDAYLGEFLNPGLNCSDILDHEVDAKDGFYWITLGGAKQKVWCDMTTDGGGYMLVARKHDAMVWDIPSKDQPVGPHSSDKYWTSQLGDAPILDFRIQLSTTDSFDGTKAHWSYRLKNKRPLGELMITDRGCDSSSPGIRDIAFVKDLMTNNIVTTGFQCSVFGPAQSNTLGWAMVNKCLKTPCLGVGHTSDQTGVFSYSVSDKISGYGNQATSLIGCDHNKCCGCFGPVGGTANYCDTKCSAINGGIVIDAKNIYTWVWVKSSLPKRIWNKCMEYQIPNENGQLEWFTLTGDSAIPEKGRCSSNLRLNSGVVVVPDKATAKKVPKIPGLLEYRQDENKLYLRANKTWNLLTQNKEVKGKLIKLEEYMESRLKELQRKIDVKYTELNRKINAGNAELKKHFNISIPNNKLPDEVERKYPGCVKYQWLTDYTRLYSYYSANRPDICDSNLSGWYRFGGGAGTQMSTRCVKDHYCGAYYPGYMTGSHPSANDGIVNRTVHFFYAGYCTYYSTSIQVINCADLYYVYYLNGVPVPGNLSCKARYCSNYNKNIDNKNELIQ